ncbi:MAG: transposase [Oligoflexia bacterium]|nr:transposase [Oligoflexia bacterium]
MPRRNLIRTSNYPYHITIRCNNREWFDLPLADVWEICIRNIVKSNKKHPVNIYGFVLMSNHYHLLIDTPNNNIDEFMFELNRNISHDLRILSGRINRIFGDRYKWCIIKDKKHFINVLRYVYRNPKRYDVVKKCEDYIFSSLYYIVNKIPLAFTPYEPYIGELDGFLRWINDESSEKIDGNEDNDAKLQKALSRSFFKYPIKRTSRRSSRRSMSITSNSSL